MATTATASTWKAPSHSHTNSRSSRPLTTPRNIHPMTTTNVPVKTPLTSSVRSPQLNNDVNSSSPSYFGFVVGNDTIPGDSGPGPHVRQNWNDVPQSSSRPSATHERNPDYEMFRRQSEKNVAFSLNGLPQTRSIIEGTTPNQIPQSPVSPTNTNIVSHDLGNALGHEASHATDPTPSTGDSFFLGIQRQSSPLSMSPRSSVADSQNARLSLPAHEIQASLQSMKPQRSDTLPVQPNKEYTAMLGPQEVAKVIQTYSEKTLILDLRVYPQYAASRVRGALNLCIPTTLLKRPAYTVQKLADTFASESDKRKFSQWSKAQYIVVYDATSCLAKEATTSFHVLKKFMTEGWKGNGLVVKGGFAGMQKVAPSLIDKSSKSLGQAQNDASSAKSPLNQSKLPVVGGCAMPSTENAANPFFGNIRQNEDLRDGVGQLPIKKPADMRESENQRLPSWLKRAASTSDEGKAVSQKFLGIEEMEQKRMQSALSVRVSYGTPASETPGRIQVAGIEKGSKNRYNNIFPFEHSRVHLQNVPSNECDYVNASFVKAGYSNRRYIATQAPIPQTFNDFWRVVWEQNVGVVVMLTAEAEGGQVKSHPYWKTGNYGTLKVIQTLEKEISLRSNAVNTREEAPRKTTSGRRLTTSNATPATEKTFNFDITQTRTNTIRPEEEPVVMIRQFKIANSQQLSLPARTVVQVHYSQWPDFGAPASPQSILSLVDIVDKFQREVSTPSTVNSPSEPAKSGQKPVIVHCSAGCGRTGTFCTIDSVIDMLKRQRRERARSKDDMEIDSADDWVKRDDIDLVAKAVEDFRNQRLSMVQNLRQFVLCYESILQWLHENK